MLTVKKCKFGRGVFATKDIPKGKIIVVNHLLLITDADRKNSPTIRRYDFSFNDGDETGLALGIASLINHSVDKENADYCTYSYKGFPIVEVVTSKKIKKGNQIFINYGYDPTEDL